jgi:hypothetical protein
MRIQSGTFYLGSITTSDGQGRPNSHLKGNPNRRWGLNSPNGRREYQARVQFPRAFETKPAVQVGVHGMNANVGTGNTRKVAVELIKLPFYPGKDDPKEYFGVQVSTNDGSVIDGVYVTWSAHAD